MTSSYCSWIDEGDVDDPFGDNNTNDPFDEGNVDDPFGDNNTNDPFDEGNVDDPFGDGGDNEADDDSINAFDWNITTATDKLPETGSAFIYFSGPNIPLINSYRLFHDPISSSPSTFFFEGSICSADYSTCEDNDFLFSPYDVVYRSVGWKQFDLVSTPKRYNRLRFTNRKYLEEVVIHELQFLVCNRPANSIEYPETEYSFYKDYEQISISPIQYGYSDCSIQPSLPDGMSIDPNTCIISGVSHSLGSQQYTVTSTMVTPPIQSILNLTFIHCSGSVYKIIRNYMDNPQNEYFSIQDTSNESILYQINSGHSSSSLLVELVSLSIHVYISLFNSSLTLILLNQYSYRN